MGFGEFNDRQNLVIQGLAYLDIDNKPGSTIKDILNNYPDKNSNNYKNIKNLVGNDTELLNLEVVHVCNNNPGQGGSDSGLYALVLKDDEGNTGFSFRGTENMSLDIDMKNIDQLDNIVSAFAPTSVQNHEALLLFDKYSNNNDDNYLYGHSKGGNIAQEVFVKRDKKIKEVHVINPFPVNYSKLNHRQKKAMASDKMNVVVIGGDVVSFFGLAPYINRIRYVKCQKGATGFF